MKKIAVLTSNGGTGTNLQAIINGVESGKINAEITVVVSGDEDACGLVRAKKHNIPTLVVDKNADLVQILTEQYPVDLIVLAVWKRIIPEVFLKVFKNKILNLHPGLIPDSISGVVKNPDGTDALWNKGIMTNKAMQNFLNHQATYAGSSIHYLSEEFDFGPVLGRCFEKIELNDTIESLYTRLKVKENQLFVECLVKLSNE